MAAKFPALPTELIELITSHMHNEDVLSLRLVCRDLSQKAARSVNPKAFKTLRTDLSLTSLEKLKQISQHENFRHRVQSLEIKGPSCPSYRSRLKSVLRSPRASPRGTETLLNILQNGLVNCRSFRICYNFRPRNVSQNSNAIAVLFDIIAKSGLPIQSFELTFSFAEPTMRMGRLKEMHQHLPRFRQGWAHLQDLTLQHNILPKNVDWTAGVIICAVNLQKLTLYPSKQPAPHSSGSIDAINGFSTLIKLLSDTKLQPVLKELSLSGAYVREEDLSRLVLHYQNTLRAFSLRHISMIGGGTWASAFGSWKSRFPVLEKFSVWLITDSEREWIRFDDVGAIPGTGGQKFNEENIWIWHDWLTRNWHSQGVGIGGVSYKGPHASKALGYLATSIKYMDYRCLITQEDIRAKYCLIGERVYGRYAYSSIYY